MDIGLKQRLVGALVLLALGVLFLPVLFEPDHRRAIDRTSQVPPAPDYEPLQVSSPQRNPEVGSPPRPAAEQFQLAPDDDAGSREPEPVMEERPESESGALVTAEPEPDRQPLDEQGLANAWVVQLASFNSEERAAVLRDELLEADYPAFTRTLDTSKGRMTRVYVGPKLHREQAEQLKQTLDRAYSVEALVLRFTP